MDWNQFLSLVSLPVIVIIYALTEAASYFVAKTPQGKAPRWFIFIPIIGGFIVGILHYAGFTPTETIIAQTWGKTAVLSVFEGLLTAAAAIIVFEFRKQIKKRLWPKGGSDVGPTQ